MKWYNYKQEKIFPWTIIWIETYCSKRGQKLCACWDQGLNTWEEGLEFLFLDNRDQKHLRHCWISKSGSCCEIRGWGSLPINLVQLAEVWYNSLHLLAGENKHNQQKVHGQVGTKLPQYQQGPQKQSEAQL